MTPYEHSLLSVRDFKGIPEDYLKIHEFLDSTKLHFSDYKHRAVLHNSFGMGLCEQVFGANIVNSDGYNVSVREVARRHITQDLCKVPTLKESLQSLINGTSFELLNNINQKELRWLEENQKKSL